MTRSGAVVQKSRCSSEVRCAQVLDAAERCVQRLGFHNASMAEIAAAAGMSVGHIYRYFPSKEAIIVAIVERDAAQALAEVEALEREGDCVRSALLAYARRIIDRCASPDRLAVKVEVMAEAARNPRVAEVVRLAYGEVQARMFAMIRRGRPEQPEAVLRRQMDAVDLIFGGLLSTAVRMPTFDREAMAELVADCIARVMEA